MLHRPLALLLTSLRCPLVSHRLPLPPSLSPSLALSSMSAPSLPPLPVPLSAWTSRAYGCVDSLDARGFSACFSEDIWMRFANQPPLSGRESAYAAFSTFFQRLTSLTHDISHEWRTDHTAEGTAILLEASVTYVVDNGGTCTVPATTSWRLRVEADGVERAHWVQIYVDLAPLYALLAAPGSHTEGST